MLTWIGKTGWQSAQTTLFVTLMRPGESGVYFENCESVMPNPDTLNTEAAKKLVKMTRKKLMEYLPPPVIPVPSQSA